MALETPDTLRTSHMLLWHPVFLTSFSTPFISCFQRNIIRFYRDHDASNSLGALLILPWLTPTSLSVKGGLCFFSINGRCLCLQPLCVQWLSDTSKRDHHRRSETPTYRDLGLGWFRSPRTIWGFESCWQIAAWATSRQDAACWNRANMYVLLWF